MNASKIFELRFPKIGETSSGGLIIQWLKKEGETIVADEALLEVSTDKVVTEISSPVSGVLEKICVPVGQEAEPDSLLAMIILGSSKKEEASVKESMEVVDIEKAVLTHQENSFLSPVVIAFAQDHGVSLDLLKNIKGSGHRGRVTKKDIECFVAQQSEQRQCSSDKTNDNIETFYEEIPVNGLRLILSKQFSKSVDIPTVFLISEIDVSLLAQKIIDNKTRFYDSYGIKLTPTPFFVEGIIAGLKAFPLMNSSWNEHSILLRKQINLGFAVDLNYQGLVLPILHNCGDKDSLSLIQEMSRLAKEAKENKLEREYLMGGTISFTNVGTGGASIGLPLVLEGQTTMVAVGAIKKKVGVSKTGDIVVIDSVQMTIAFDHRVVDGVYASHFLKAIQQYLEEDAYKDALFL